MTEGTEVKPEGGQPQQSPQAQAQAQPQAQPQHATGDDMDVESTINALASMGITSPELESIGQPPAQEPQANPDERKPEPFRSQQPEAGPEAGQAPVEQPPAEQPPAEANPGTSPELTIQSEIFGENPVNLEGEQTTLEEPKFESVDEVSTYMKELYGVENFNELKSKFDGYEKQSDQLTEANNQVAGYQEIFKQLPPELHKAVTSHYNGNDWRTEISNAPADFSKDVNNLKTEDLVNRYNKDQFSADDWEEYNDPDGDPNIKKAVNIALEASKQLYSNDKAAFDGNQQQMIDSHKLKQENYANSITATVSKLTDQVEGVDQSYVSRVDKALRGGGLQNLFFNEDGTMKEDAAKRFTYAMHGEELYKQALAAAKKNIKNNAQLDVLERTPETSRSTGASKAAADDIRPEVKKKVDEIRNSTGSSFHY